MNPKRNTQANLNLAKIERLHFRDRLHQALKSAGYTRSPTALATLFNAKYTTAQITAQSARKWLLGESIPRQDKLRHLSSMLNVTSDWLRFGTEARTAEAAPRSPIIANIMADVEAMEKPMQCLARDIIRAMLSYGTAYPTLASGAANG